MEKRVSLCRVCILHIDSFRYFLFSKKSLNDLAQKMLYEDIFIRVKYLLQTCLDTVGPMRASSV